MRIVLLVLALSATACTRANPNAILGGGGGNDDLAANHLSDGGTRDLRGADLAGGGPGGDLAGLDMTGGADDLAVPDDAAATDLRTGPDLMMQDAPGTCVPPTVPLTRFVTSGVALMGSGPLTVAVPDGYRLDGTMTLGGGFPAGSSFEEAVVDVYGSDGSSVRVPGTFAGPSGFTYSVVVPAGTYQVRGQLVLTLSDGTFANRLETRSVTVCGDTRGDLTMPAIPPMTTKTVTVSGLGALVPAADGVRLVMETSDAKLTLFSDSVGIAAGSALVSMTLPLGTLLPTVAAFRNGSLDVPRSSAYLSNFRITSSVVVDTGALSPIALPPVVEIAGAVNDPTGQLVNPSDGGVAVDFFTQQLSCQTAADARHDDSSTTFFFTDAPTFALPVRKDVQCQLLPTLLVGMRIFDPAAAARVNTLASLFIPDNVAPVVTFSASNTGESFAVPNLGTRFAVNGTLANAHGAPLAGYDVFALSSALNGLSSNQLQVTATSDGAGTYDLHVIAGTYTIIVQQH